MNTTFTSRLDWRFATKKFDPAKKVSSEDLANILRAIQFAPTSFGLQPFKVYVVENPAVRQKFEALWQTPLDDKRGLTVVEIIDAVHTGEIKGMYIMGENPAMSDPDVEHARAALAHLEHLVVQDIFLTETAYLADVVLPASAWPE